MGLLGVERRPWKVGIERKKGAAKLNKKAEKKRRIGEVLRKKPISLANYKMLAVGGVRGTPGTHLESGRGSKQKSWQSSAALHHHRQKTREVCRDEQRKVGVQFEDQDQR